MEGGKDAGVPEPARPQEGAMEEETTGGENTVGTEDGEETMLKRVVIETPEVKRKKRK